MIWLVAIINTNFAHLKPLILRDHSHSTGQLQKYTLFKVSPSHQETTKKGYFQKKTFYCINYRVIHDLRPPSARQN